MQAGRINQPVGGIYKDEEGRTVAKRKVVGDSTTRAFGFSREARNTNFYVKSQCMYIQNVGDSENYLGFSQSVTAH